MKKLMAIAAIGVALAAIPVTVAMKRTGVTVGSDNPGRATRGQC
jgi:hypothetical protein